MFKFVLALCFMSCAAQASHIFGSAKNPLQAAEFKSTKIQVDVQAQILKLINTKAEPIQKNIEKKLRQTFGTTITYFFPNKLIDHFVIDDDKDKNGKLAWIEKEFVTKDQRTCRLTIFMMISLDETKDQARVVFADLPSKHFPGDTDLICASNKAKFTSSKDLATQLPKGYLP